MLDVSPYLEGGLLENSSVNFKMKPEGYSFYLFDISLPFSLNTEIPSQLYISHIPQLNIGWLDTLPCGYSVS